MFFRLLQKIAKRKTGVYTLDDIRAQIAERNYLEAVKSIRHLSEKLPYRKAHQKCLQAEIAFHEGRDTEAADMFKGILLSYPAFADAHYGLSLVYAESGEIQSALEHAVFAKNLSPETARYLAQLGYCYMKVQAYPAAEGILRNALKLDSKSKQVWNNLAIVLRMKGDPAQAKAAWLQALVLDPDFLTAQNNMQILDEEILKAEHQFSVVKVVEEDKTATHFSPINSRMPWADIYLLLKSDQQDAALNLAEQSLPVEMSVAEVIEMARLYRHALDFQSANEMLASFVERNPSESLVWRELAELQLEREQYAASIPAFERAIATGENNPEIHMNFGSALHSIERYSDALTQFEKAVSIDSKPAFRKRQAAALVMCCRYEEALTVYEELLNENVSTLDELRGNMAVCCSYLGRFEEAEQMLDRIIENEIHDPAFRMMRGMVHLLHGRWYKGWQDYVWRAFSRDSAIRTLPYNKWRGEALAGKSIVVLAEQGLGDQIMFASCISDLLKHGPSRVVLEVHERVSKTLRRSFPNCEVVASRQKKDLQWVKDLGMMDYFVPLADLPMYFRNDDAEFPALPYLRADPDEVIYWRSQLEAFGPAPYVGFSWKGGTELTRTTLRTASVDHFRRLASQHQGTWICLQYGNIGPAVERARGEGFRCGYWPNAIEDLDKFAGLVSALDAVVTVCNTTVHFAGAMGVPTIVVAPEIPEWRYGISFYKLPWYLNARVLRQARSGSWNEVFDDASGELRQLFRSDDITHA